MTFRQLFTILAVLVPLPISAQGVPESCIDSFAELDRWIESGRSSAPPIILRGFQNIQENWEVIREIYGIPDRGVKQTGSCTQLCTREFIEAMTNIDLQGQLDAGADINAYDQNGFTSLISTILSNTPEKAVWLLEAGADPTKTGYPRETPLHFAAQELRTNHSIIQELVNYGADTEVINSLGLTPLAAAIIFGTPSSVEMLLKAGVEVDIPNFYGKLPIFAILGGFRQHGPFEGEQDYYTLLFNAGADINAQNDVGATSIGLAAFKGSEVYVEILLSLGADASIPGQFGITPYCYAILGERFDDPVLLERLRLAQ